MHRTSRRFRRVGNAPVGDITQDRALRPSRSTLPRGRRLGPVNPGGIMTGLWTSGFRSLGKQTGKSCVPGPSCRRSKMYRNARDRVVDLGCVPCPSRRRCRRRWRPRRPLLRRQLSRQHVAGGVQMGSPVRAPAARDDDAGRRAGQQEPEQRSSRGEGRYSRRFGLSSSERTMGSILRVDPLHIFFFKRFPESARAWLSPSGR